MTGREPLHDVAEVSRRNLSDDSPFTMRAVSMLASALGRLGRTNEAIALYEGILRAEQRGGVMTPRAARVRINIALVLTSASRLADAGKRLVELERELQDNRPASLDGPYGSTLYNLGCLTALRGDRASALDLVGRAVHLGEIPATQLEQDTDLVSLRGPDLDALIARAKGQGGTAGIDGRAVLRGRPGVPKPSELEPDLRMAQGPANPSVQSGRHLNGLSWAP